MDELWKPTPYANYEVSNLGHVRNTKSGQWGHPLTEPRLHKPISTPKGYQRVMLCLNGKAKNVPLARLVASAFIGEMEQGQVIIYKDNDRTNCAADNLEYGTKAHSTELKRIRDYVANGDNSALGRELTRRTKRSAQLERAKEAYRLVKEEGWTLKRTAEFLKMSESGVCRIVNASNNKMLEKANATKE